MKNLSKKIFTTLASLSCVCSASKPATNALTKMANKSQNLKHTQDSNEIVVDDALIKKLQYHPTVIKYAVLIAILGMSSGSLGTYLIMKDMYKHKVQLVDKKLLMKFINDVVIAAGFNDKLIITQEPSYFKFFNKNGKELFYDDSPQAAWDKFRVIATDDGISDRQLMKKVFLDFYSLYFDVIDNVRSIARKYKLSTEIKKYIEHDINCLAFQIIKNENNKLELKISHRTNTIDKELTNKFQSDENDKRFFSEIENYLINNEYVKYIFQIR